MDSPQTEIQIWNVYLKTLSVNLCDINSVSRSATVQFMIFLILFRTFIAEVVTRFDVFISIRAAGTGVIFNNCSWFGLYWGVFLNWIWRYFAWHFWFSGCWRRGLFWFRIRIGNGSCRGCRGFANLSNDLSLLGLIEVNSFTFWVDNFFFC